MLGNLIAHSGRVFDALQPRQPYAYILLLKGHSVTVAGVDTLAGYVGYSSGMDADERFNIRNVVKGGHLGRLIDEYQLTIDDFDYIYLCGCTNTAVAKLAETGFILAFGTWRDVTGLWGLNMTLGAGAGEVRTQTSAN